MSRLTWFTAGAVTGVYAMVKARHAARNFTPDGLAARAAALGVGFRMFTSEVAVGMMARESELRDQLALAPGAAPGAVPGTIEQATTPPQHKREETSDGHR